MPYFKFWKDKDIIILLNKPVSKKQFYEMMMYIGSVKYGLTDEQVLKRWMDDINDAR